MYNTLILFWWNIKMVHILSSILLFWVIKSWIEVEHIMSNVSNILVENGENKKTY